MKKPAGYTLIEIMVTTIIILFLARGSMILASNVLNRNKTLDLAREIRKYLVLSRNYAVVSQGLDGLPADVRSVGVTIRDTGSLQPVAYFADTTVGLYTSAVFDMSDLGLTIPATNLVFEQYSGRSLLVSDFVITVTSGLDTGVTRTVVVKPSGLVELY